MIFEESETVELKESVTREITKEIVAFANSNGGKLYIGVRDDGTVTGLQNPDTEALRISNMVRDTIKPDVTMFVHYQTMDENGKKIIAISVQRGTDRPYYLAEKGMRPSGVIVRQGFSSVPASESAIRRMIKETDGDRFENIRSLDQSLTFEAAEKEFLARQIDFGTPQMRSLKMVDQDGLFSNLGLLLSDQCLHTVKAAVFQGTDSRIFKDRREFRGSLFQQMNDLFEFIDFRNQTKATFDKLWRKDVRDYPEEAIREALLNMLVHRDYSFHSSAFVSIYEDRIEFTSIGGLVPGFELEDIFKSISVCRNQNLADVFYRLNLIEAYGTGINRIMRAYDGCNESPIIEATNNTFTVVLPNVNYSQETESFQSKRQVVNLQNSGKEKADSDSECIPIPGLKYGNRESLTSGQTRILAHVSKFGEIKKSDVMKLLEVSSATATRILRKMVDHHQLQQVGKARNTRYLPFDSEQNIS